MWRWATVSMMLMHRWRAWAKLQLPSSFLIFLASSSAEVSVKEGKSLFTKLGHHPATSLFSLENKNLLQAAPQKMTAF
ncbi:hypothetical protein ACFX1S_022999 [Malus domestica]